MKQYQISEQLFIDLVKWHLGGLQDLEREARICAGLQNKLSRVTERQSFSENLRKRQ